MNKWKRKLLQLPCCCSTPKNQTYRRESFVHPLLILFTFETRVAALDQWFLTEPLGPLGVPSENSRVPVSFLLTFM